MRSFGKRAASGGGGGGDAELERSFDETSQLREPAAHSVPRSLRTRSQLCGT
tara:strand:- start:513 stop:668 length:156 start_codon:yes stop_codon:yes gene_type:complete